MVDIDLQGDLLSLRHIETLLHFLLRERPFFVTPRQDTLKLLKLLMWGSVLDVEEGTWCKESSFCVCWSELIGIFCVFLCLSMMYFIFVYWCRRGSVLV